MNGKTIEVALWVLTTAVLLTAFSLGAWAGYGYRDYLGGVRYVYYCPETRK